MTRASSRGLIVTMALLLPIFLSGRAEAFLETGLTAGVNFASLDDIDLADSKTSYESKTGWHFGVFLKSALGPLGLRAGAVYLDAGPLFEGISEITEDPAGFEDDFDVRFFSVPIDLQYRLPLPAAKPYILAGPELRFNMTSSDEFEDNFKSTWWGGNIGAGIEFSLPFFDLSLAPEFRYTFDLTGMTEETLKIGTEELKASDAFEAGTYHLRLHFGF